MTDNRHDFAKGATINEEGQAKLRQRYAAVDSPALLQELSEQRGSAVDFVADTRGMQMVLGDRDSGVPVITPTEPADWYATTGALPLTPYAHEQVAARLGVPAKHYNRLLTDHPDLLAHEVTTLWQREPKRTMVRTLRGQARAVLSDRFQRVDHLDVLQVVMPILTAPGSEWQVHEFGLTDRRLHLRAIVPTLSTEIRVGDVVQMGFTLSNSEVGAGALSVLPALMRVVCSNLAVVNQSGLRKVHLGRQQDDLVEVLSEETRKMDDLAFLMKVRDVVRALTDRERFMALVTGIRENADRPLVEPATASEVLAKKVGLSQAEERAMLGTLIGSGDATYWGAMNALTATAREVQNYDRRADLELAAGGLMLSRSAANEICNARAA